MLTRNTLRRPLPVVAAGVLVAALGAGSATAATIITGRDVKDGSLGSADLRDGSVRVKDLRAAAVATLRGHTGKTGPQGAQGPQGPAGTAAPAERPGWVGAEWSIVDRNVIGNGDSYLRPGPDNAPWGVGSLGLRTGSGSDKAAFGNQVDFAGDRVEDLTSVGLRVFTTGENVVAGGSAPNMPSITFEIDPNVSAVASSYSSLVFMPDSSAPNGWSGYIDATSTGRWGLTGSRFAGTTCDINGARCTFAQVQEYLADGGDPATILTAQITKGRDFAFSGAVDGLRLNDTVYDFEPLGVVARAAG